MEVLVVSFRCNCLTVRGVVFQVFDLFRKLLSESRLIISVHRFDSCLVMGVCIDYYIDFRQRYYS